jgi:RNA polymerase sigma-70 factor (ECF subfamily)
MDLSHVQPTSAELLPSLPSPSWTGKSTEDLFKELFDENYLAVQKFFARRGVPAEECQDLAQETFLKAYSHLDSFRGEANPRTWLYRIAQNHLLNVRRSRTTRKREGKEVSLDVLLEAGPPPGNVEDREADPLKEVLSGELSRRLRDAVDRLPPQMQRCVLLRVYHDLRYREIAEVLRVSIDTVKAHLYQARQILKGKLSDVCNFED